LPAFACDPKTGQLYLTWSDKGNGDADILLTTSKDHGQSWTTPIRVNDDPLRNGANQFQPQMVVAPGGVVSISIFDTRNDPLRWRAQGRSVQQIYSSASTSSLKNNSASVTTAAAWKLPRSASLVTTAGLMSTTTVRTVEGSRFPVAMACNMEAIISAISTPFTSLRILRCASCISLMTPGMGPSSRIEPASTMGILRSMAS